MKVIIDKMWSIGKCEDCESVTKVSLMIQTGGRFRAYCCRCDDWVDYVVFAHDIEFRELEEDVC